MNYINLTNDELLANLSKSLRQYKLFQLYLNDMKRDYRKNEAIDSKYESARHEYLDLFKEVKSRGLKLEGEDRVISRLLFN